MADVTLAAELKSSFEALSPWLKEAARWMIDHPADVALLTRGEQARRAGVTPATLTRLAQRFGLRGYDDVRKLYAEAVRQRPATFRGRAEELLERRNSEGDAALVQDMFAALSRHMQAFAAPAAIARLSAAAERIVRAERVFCLGLRSSFSVAYMFHYVRSLFGAGIDVLRSIGAADVLVAITVNPYTRQTVQAVRYAGGRGAGVVAVTDSEMSPLRTIADHTIIVHTETPSFFHTMAPAFAAVECLAALVAARRGTATLTALAASEEQLAAFDTYLVAPRKKRTRA